MNQITSSGKSEAKVTIQTLKAIPLKESTLEHLERKSGDDEII